MGTDIHGRIQRRDNDGRYEDIGEIEGDRNYTVFAILAGVRNGSGFAGVRTHTPIEPISAPRGLPEDLGFKERDYSEFDDPSIESPQSKEVPYAPFDFGDHSESWLTLSEILAWPHWDEKIHLYGYLDRAEYERVMATGDSPKEWCGGVSGPSIVCTEHANVQAGNSPGNWTNVLYEWDVPLRDRVKTFRLWLDYLQSKYGWLLERDPAAVRLVFGFDS